MAREYLEQVVLGPKLHLTHIGPGHGDAGWWLYDECRGINLAIKAKTEREAFTKALEYYQERCNRLEQKNHKLQTKIENFVEQFLDEEGNYNGVGND
jgi:hypothetical protein